MKRLILITAAIALTSCEQFKAFVIANEATIATAAAETARLGATAGINRLKPSAKAPLEKLAP